MDVQPGVLIVDSAEETRAVLCAALEQRGLRAWCAASSREGLSLAEQHRPDCIVVDLELTGPGPDSPAAEQLAAGFAAAAPNRPLVLLGQLPRTSAGYSSARAELVSKPYHYGPLIRKIECLLAAQSSQAS